MRISANNKKRKKERGFAHNDKIGNGDSETIRVIVFSHLIVLE